MARETHANAVRSARLPFGVEVKGNTQVTSKYRRIASVIFMMMGEQNPVDRKLTHERAYDACRTRRARVDQVTIDVVHHDGSAYAPAQTGNANA